MTQAEISRIRLASLGLIPDDHADAFSATAALGAMQAQDYQGLLWSLGSRVSKSTKDGMEAALAAGKIVRTWLFRGTLHLTAAEDLRWMLALVARKLIASTLRRREALGLGDENLALSRKTLVAALGGGKALDRRALLAKLEEAGISTAGGRGYHLIFRAAIDGVICQGAPNGTEQDFVLLDDWVPSGKKLEGEAAFAELVHRYFTSHGPATLQDFVGWAGLTVREARSGLAAAGDKLERVVVEGKEYWMASGASALDRAGADGVFLIAGFDEFMLGYKNRDAALDPDFAERICPGNNGVFFPTIVSGGRVVGTWKRTIKKGSVVVTPAPFIKFDIKERDGIAEAAERYSDFLGLSLRLEGL